LKRGLIFRSPVVFACGVALAGIFGLLFSSPQAQRPASGKTHQAPSARGAIWKSQTTGREYRVQIEKERIYAEWVNLPAVAAREGAYIRSECRHVGSKWVGTSRIFLPCSMGTTGPPTNHCHMLMRMEIESITPSRITGRSETPKGFDCQNCRVLSTVWANFVWAPKR